MTHDEAIAYYAEKNWLYWSDRGDRPCWTPCTKTEAEDMKARGMKVKPFPKGDPSDDLL